MKEARHTSFLQQTVTETRRAAANGTVRKQTSVLAAASATAVGGNRSSLREDESVDGNALLIRLGAFAA